MTVLEKCLLALITTEEKNLNSIIPAPGNILRAFNTEVYPKVIIIGQDPYPYSDLATGLAFGVPKGSKIPPSLRIIFRELHKEYPETEEVDETLESWAQQGVILLNSSLTTTIGKTGEHTEIWLPFMQCLIRELSGMKVCDPEFRSFVFVLLGKHAQRLRPFIHEGLHHIIERPHPAAEIHGGESFKGFFKEVNNLLTEPIKW